jgi:hypothetical protein
VVLELGPGGSPEPFAAMHIAGEHRWRRDIHVT